MARKGLEKQPIFVELVIATGIREAARYSVAQEAARSVFTDAVQAICMAFSNGQRNLSVIRGLQFVRGEPWQGRVGTKLHAVLTRLDQEGAALLVHRAALSSSQADALMHAVIAALLRQYSGTQLYVPAHRAPVLDGRDEGLMDAWEQPGPDGARRCSVVRTEQVASEFGLSVAHVYAILARVRRLRREAAGPVAGSMASSGAEAVQVAAGAALQSVWAPTRPQPAEVAEEGV